MKITTNKKVLFSAFLGLFVIGLFFGFQIYSKNYFDQRNNVLDHINAFLTKETELKYEVLQSSFFLYRNFDKIVEISKDIEAMQEEFEKDHLPSLPTNLKQDYMQYKHCSKEARTLILDFETVNSIIKNSLTYMASLLRKLPEPKNEYERQYMKEVLSAISSIYLAKYSFDKDFVQELHAIQKSLQRYRFKSSPLRQYHSVLMAHISIFTQEFPRYIHYLDHILHNHIPNKLLQFKKEFLAYADRKLANITLFFAIFVALFLATILYNIRLLIILDKENRHLDKLSKTDMLTNLFNRHYFFIRKKYFKHPAVLLVNIDRFKHFNDFYGTETGDCILQEVALKLKENIPHNSEIFRVGGDDFAILLESENHNLEQIASRLVAFFKNNEIVCGNLKLFISISIGISDEDPLLETADIALKEVKKDPNRYYLRYQPSQDLIKKIDQNIQMTNILQKAIKNGLIVPHYQAIIDPTSKEVFKYEALARIKTDKGYETIYPYITIAKEIRLYPEITRTILEKTFRYFNQKDFPVSINISMNDIVDPTFLDNLAKLLQSYPNMANKLTLELLESESITDYTLVKSFIEKIKGYGITIAIDDFGSGYSNFEHLLNLQIDYLKIDGSLIKNIHTDPNARLIVQTIIDFAKKAGFKTIAEFVHSKEVLQATIELGIDYVQGFYLHKPSPTID